MIESHPEIVIRFDRQKTPVGSDRPSPTEVGKAIKRALEEIDPGIQILGVGVRSVTTSWANLDPRPYPMGARWDR